MQNTGVVFAVMGLGLTALAVGLFVRQHLRLARWVRVRGTVVGHRVRRTVRDGRRRTFHHPLVRFPAGGREWVHESPLSTSQPRRDVGAQVELLHAPDDPEQACIDEVREKHFVSLLVGAIGVVFTATGFWLL